MTSAWSGRSTLRIRSTSLSLFTRSWDAGVYGDVPDEIRPLVALSYQVDFATGSGALLAFHVTNITLHILNSLLVLGLARVIGRASWAGAALAGAFFAVMPAHAETVAWISGRADSIPTLFYLGSLLGFAVWRRFGSPNGYVTALVCCFFALFSKQNGITIPLIIGAYDLVVERQLPRPTWRYFAPYVPFVALTLAYLGLRYYLFGNMVRENVVAPSAFAPALVDTIANQVEILLFGYFALEDLPSNLRVLLRGGLALAIVLAVTPAVWSMRRTSTAIAPVDSVVSRLVFFGPVWWLINVAPLTVTYAAARHLYLPAVGLAVVVGILFDVLHHVIRTRIAFAVPLVAAAALGLCGVRLLGPIGEWVGSAQISETMARELHAQASSTPPGSLIVVGASRTAVLSPPRALASSAPRHQSNSRATLALVVGHALRPPTTIYFSRAQRTRRLRRATADRLLRPSAVV